MPLFCVTWKLFDDKKSEASTYFASMTEGNHANDRGTALKPYGRWHNFSNGTGMGIVEAPTADDVFFGGTTGTLGKQIL